MADFALELEAQIPRLRRYARVLCWDRDCADDLVQSCLTRAIAKQHLWKHGSDLPAWLITMLHNLHVTELRRAARSRNVVPIEHLLRIQSIEPDAFDVLALRDMKTAIGKLNDEHRQAVLLVGLAEMPYEEAAAFLGIPTGTLRSRLSRARNQLRILMGMEVKHRRIPADVRASQRLAA